MKTSIELQSRSGINLFFALLVFALPVAGQNRVSDDVKSFRINVASGSIVDLQHRIAATRWPDAIKNSGWTYGVNSSYLQQLARYWQTSFNWKTQENRLNQFHHYTVSIDGHSVHFVYERGKGKRSTPVVLLHGWPSSFVQMIKIIPLLTQADPTGHSFDVIVPSLIGCGFSDRATEKGMTVHRMAGLFQTLMTQKLGYRRFMLRGSDIGAGVAKEWAIAHPTSVMGVHLSGSNPYVYGPPPANLSEAEKTYLQKGQQFMQAEGAYAQEQSTKPQTLAYGLNDSPVGLAAWIVEKFKTWSDNGGNLESTFSKDELLTNISLYWFTQTIGSSMRVYYESAHTGSPNGAKKVIVPTAFMMLQHDIAVAPRKWEERTYNVTRWHVNPRGGHFGEWEQPALIVEDMRSFLSELSH